MNRYPPQIKYIIGNEACERFTYYGLMGILELYLVNRMALGEAQATQTLHLFGTAVYLLPLLGGWLADRWFGRYWTILSISLVYCLGCGSLALFEGSPAALFLGLALIAIGAGGIKPCVSAFVGDQFGPDQQLLLPRVYGWFYWAINLGSAGGFFILPWVHARAGYRWAFAVPGAAMALATLFFWLGTKYYVRRPAAPPSERLRVAPVILYALTRCLSRKPGEKFLDPARGHFSPQDVQGARTVLGILGVFGSIPMFWALFNQVNSTWVLQGKNMTAFYWLNGETMQGAGAVLVMIWVPLLTLWLYPLAERLGWRPTPLRRMSAGHAAGGRGLFHQRPYPGPHGPPRHSEHPLAIGSLHRPGSGGSHALGYRPRIRFRPGALAVEKRDHEFLAHDHRGRAFPDRRVHLPEPPLRQRQRRLRVLVLRHADVGRRRPLHLRGPPLPGR